MSGDERAALAEGAHGHEGHSRKSMTDRLLLVLLACVVAAPLLLGAARPAVWSGMALWVGVLLVTWALMLTKGRVRLVVPPRRVAFIAVPIVLVLIWAWLQASGLLPMPLVDPLWREVEGALGLPVARALTLDPQAAYAGLLRAATYVGVFFLAFQLCRAPNTARRAVAVLAWAGTAYATYGLAMHLTGTEWILWMPKWAYLGDLTSTFVNRNAYGAYAAIGLLCCLARLSQAIAPLHSGRSLRLRDLADRLAVRAAPMVVACFILATALLLTHSRGAMLSVFVGLLVLIGAFVTSRLMTRRTALLLVLAGLPLLVGLIIFSGDGTLARLADTPTYIASEAEARTLVNRLGLEAVARAPWTGYGLGSFLVVFRQIRDTGLPASLVWDYAHNMHLELVMDLGIPGALMVYAAAVALVLVLVDGLRKRRRDRVYPALALACLATAMAHGLVDFSPQIPAVSVTLAMLMGIGVGQSWTHSNRTKLDGVDAPEADHAISG